MRRSREDREALRRRLYGRDASAAVVQRYATAQPSAVRRSGPARRRPRRVPLLAAAVVLAVGTVAALLLIPTAPPLPAPTAVGLSAEDRTDLLQNLARGGDAGIAAYLVTHPSPPGLVTTPGTITDELHGTGAQTVPLDLAQVPTGAGSTTVLLTTSVSTHVSWTALGSGAASVRVVAAREGDQAAGDLTTATFATADGRRPLRLRVEVADGVRWGAAVVFTG